MNRLRPIRRSLFAIYAAHGLFVFAEHGKKFLFVDHADPQRKRLLQFAARIASRDDERRLARDGGLRRSAERLDLFLCLRPGHRGKSARKDDVLARKDALGHPPGRRGADARLSEPFKLVAVFPVGKVVQNGICRDVADIFKGDEFVKRERGDRLHAAEGGEIARRDPPDPLDADGVKKALERHTAAGVDRGEKVGDLFLP